MVKEKKPVPDPPALAPGEEREDLIWHHRREPGERIGTWDISAPPQPVEVPGPPEWMTAAAMRIASIWQEDRTPANMALLIQAVYEASPEGKKVERMLEALRQDGHGIDPKRCLWICPTSKQDVADCPGCRALASPETEKPVDG